MRRAQTGGHKPHRRPGRGHRTLPKRVSAQPGKESPTSAGQSCEPPPGWRSFRAAAERRSVEAVTGELLPGSCYRGALCRRGAVPPDRHGRPGSPTEPRPPLPPGVRAAPQARSPLTAAAPSAGSPRAGPAGLLLSARPAPASPSAGPPGPGGQRGESPPPVPPPRLGLALPAAALYKAGCGEPWRRLGLGLGARPRGQLGGADRAPPAAARLGDPEGPRPRAHPAKFDKSSSSKTKGDRTPSLPFSSPFKLTGFVLLGQQ